MMVSIEDKVNHVLSSLQTRKHTCHWPGCSKQVPPAMWGCRNHWYTLPQKLRSKIWAAYQPNQENTLTPSQFYIQVAREVQDWIKENYSNDVRGKASS